MIEGRKVALQPCGWYLVQPQRQPESGMHGAYAACRLGLHRQAWLFNVAKAL